MHALHVCPLGCTAASAEALLSSVVSPSYCPQTHTMRHALFTECAALAAALAPATPAALAPTVLDASWLPPGTSQRDLYLQRRVPTAHFSISQPLCER